jgi:hypothetical protein
MFAGISTQNRLFEVQTRRLDDIVGRLSAIEQDLHGIHSELQSHSDRLASIETTLKHQGERITRPEDRIPPLVHR